MKNIEGKSYGECKVKWKKMKEENKEGIRKEKEKKEKDVKMEEKVRIQKKNGSKRRKGFFKSSLH